MKESSGVVWNGDSLKALIAEHPDYPIVVLASEDANIGDCYWMYCSDVRCHVGQILDCDTSAIQDCLFTDKDDFEERFEEWLWDEMCYEYSHSGMYDDREPSEDEFQKRLAKELAFYEQYWRDVIVIYADN